MRDNPLAGTYSEADGSLLLHSQLPAVCGHVRVRNMPSFRGGHGDEVEGDEAVVDRDRAPPVRSLRNDLQRPGGGARDGLTRRRLSRSLS